MPCVEGATVHPTNASALVQEELEKVSKLFNDTAEQLAENEPTAAILCLEAEPNAATAARVPMADKEFVDAPDDELENWLAPVDEVTGTLASPRTMGDNASIAPSSAAGTSFADSSFTGSSVPTKEEEQQQLMEQKLKETVWEDLLFW
jgi:hypothetical protein